MHFQLNQSYEILERTPEVLDYLLRNISDEWSMQNEGPDSFSPYDVVGHLLHGERTDWMARIEIILSNKEDKRFTPYDRFAQYEESKGKSMNQLLDEFAEARAQNLVVLKSKKLTEADLQRKGIHPVFGEVSLQHLLATWTIHDLSHIAQITRVMCKQYKTEVGPWLAYMPILTRY